MARPKIIRQSEKCNAISTYYHYAFGFNKAKKLYDEHIPDESELFGLLINNGIDEVESKEIAKLISKRLE